MLPTAEMISVSIDATAAGIIGSAISGALIFVGRLVFNYLNGLKESNDKTRAEYKELFTTVATMNREVAVAMTNGANAMANLVDRLEEYYLNSRGKS